MALDTKKAQIVGDHQRCQTLVRQKRCCTATHNINNKPCITVCQR